ncbi:MAG: hypothetical protein VX899_17120 [Myxococcota bacterium]|nr:hypothetical protein [Myxococcota bacterium]
MTLQAFFFWIASIFPGGPTSERCEQPQVELCPVSAPVEVEQQKEKEAGGFWSWVLGNTRQGISNGV